MSEQTAQVGDWITIGQGLNSKPGVVSLRREDNSIEVVYLDGDKAVYEDMVWSGSRWEFKHSGPVAGYADKAPRLTHYVAKLRRGQ